MTKEDYGHSIIPFRGSMRRVVDIRPLDDYGREMDEPTKCRICGLTNGHDLEAHREDAREKRLQAEAPSRSRHPAGKRRKPEGDGNG